MMQHLLYLDPHPVPGPLTESLQILQTAQGLAEAGVTITLCTPRPDPADTAIAVLGKEPHPRLQFHHLPNLKQRWWFPTGSNRIFFWMADRVVATLRPDAILVRNLKLANFLLGRARSTSLPPLFFESHELFADSYARHRG
jgi:hypothetical protein